jgi:L-ribulokinase
MQIYADITGREMLISGSSQTCALGSAVSAAVLAGAGKGGYDDFETAQAKMTSLKDVSYKPNSEAQSVYNELFALYTKMHDAFGGVSNPELGSVMKELLAIKERARA